MKKLILGICASFLASAGLMAQDFSYTYSPDGDENYIILRDLVKTADDDLLIGFDYHPGENMPSAGVMKINRWGEVLWSKKITAPTAAASCSFEVVEKPDGNFYLWGLRKDFSNYTSAILCEFDGDGNMLWAKDYLLGNNVSIYSVNSIERLNSGDLQMMMTVYDKLFLMETNASGEINWGKSVEVDTLGSGKNPGFDAKGLPDGGGLCTSKRTNDLSLIRYDGEGELVWNKAYTLGPYCHSTAISDLDNGNLMLAGYLSQGGVYVPFSGEISDEDGSIVWMKTYSGIVLGYSSEVELRHDGDNLVMNMNTYGDPAKQYLVKIDQSGEVIEAMTTQDHLKMKDYNKLENVSASEHYNYGGFFSNHSLKWHGVVDMRENLFEENCIMQVFESGTAATEYTTYVDTSFSPIMSDYNSMSEESWEVVDLHLTKELTCQVLSDEIRSEEVASVSLYPNPTEGELTLTVDGEFNYVLMDLNGKTILSGSAANETQLDLTEFESGIYHISIQTANQLVQKKIIVQ